MSKPGFTTRKSEIICTILFFVLVALVPILGGIFYGNEIGLILILVGFSIFYIVGYGITFLLNG